MSGQLPARCVARQNNFALLTQKKKIGGVFNTPPQISQSCLRAKIIDFGYNLMEMPALEKN